MSHRWLVVTSAVGLAVVGVFAFGREIRWNGSPEYTATVMTLNTSDIRRCGVITCLERQLPDVTSDEWRAEDYRAERTRITGRREVRFDSRTGGRDTVFGTRDYWHDTHAAVWIEFADGERWAGVIELPAPSRSRAVTIHAVPTTR